MVRKTLLMLAASASLVALGACNDSHQQQVAYQQAAYQQSQNPPPLYASLNECVQAGNDAQLCQQAMTNAQANTPRYNSIDACAAQYGYANCHPQQGGWFGPALAGFMVGSLLANNSNGYYAGGHYAYDYGYYHRYSYEPVHVTHVVVYPTTTTASRYYTTTHTAPPAPVMPSKTITRNGFSTATPPSVGSRPASMTATTGRAQVVSANRSGGGFGSSPRPSFTRSSGGFGGFGGSHSGGFGGSRGGGFSSHSGGFGGSHSGGFG